MHGRLGNQLFQYAAARSLQEKVHQDIEISFRQVNGANTEGNIGWENSLKYFNVKPFKISDSQKSLLFDMPEISKIIGLTYGAIYRPLLPDINRLYHFQVKLAPLLDKFGLRWIANGYFNYQNYSCKEYFLNGTFESPRYFDDIRYLLLEELKPLKPICDQNKALFETAKSENSVCLSLRHFRLSGAEADQYNVCTKEYYESAIQTLKNILVKPTFIIFSDDIEWAKTAIDYSDCSCEFEASNNPVWEKLRLMYSCKHFIIPNSTFAWWAQYLGQSKDKIVVSPSKWFNNSYMSPLIEPSWIHIDSDGKVLNQGEL